MFCLFVGHPLTDPLLSLDWTAVVYDETAARSRKLAYIAECTSHVDFPVNRPNG